MISWWEDICSVGGEYTLGKEELRRMKKWKDSLKGGRLLFIGEKHLMKRKARKPF